MIRIALHGCAVALVFFLTNVAVAQQADLQTTPPVAGAIKPIIPSEEETKPATVTIVPALRPSEIVVQEIPLSFRETEAVALSESWKDKYSPPTLGRNGQVIYHFGESIASIVTSPGNVTDIELEAGEAIVSGGIFVGDSLNWEIASLAQIINKTLVSHIVVKPFRSELATTMTVLTDRRVYYFYLHSTPKRFMSSVGFNYPNNFKASFTAYQQQVDSHQQSKQREQAFAVPSETGTGVTEVAVDTLDFKYRISGDTPRWTPLRVYTDGVKTYIEMPARMRHSEAPVFAAISDDGSKELVNYRLQGDTFVIDSIVSAGILFAGVGRKQSAVKIEYVGED